MPIIICFITFVKNVQNLGVSENIRNLGILKYLNDLSKNVQNLGVTSLRSVPDNKNQIIYG